MQLKILYYIYEYIYFIFDFLDAVLTVGDVYKAVVLYVDIAFGAVEVALNPDVVHAVSTVIESKSTQVNVY